MAEEEMTTEESPPSEKRGLVRRSTFRASLRRIARLRPWESADAEDRQQQQVQGTSNGPEVRTERLPVVSLYSVREAATSMRVRRSRPRETTIAADPEGALSLSPASRQNIDRLVKRFGPEVLETAKRRQLATKRKPLGALPQVAQVKRRCSTDSQCLRQKDCMLTGSGRSSRSLPIARSGSSPWQRSFSGSGCLLCLDTTYKALFRRKLFSLGSLQE